MPGCSQGVKALRQLKAVSQHFWDWGAVAVVSYCEACLCSWGRLRETQLQGRVKWYVRIQALSQALHLSFVESWISELSATCNYRKTRAERNLLRSGVQRQCQQDLTLLTGFSNLSLKTSNGIEIQQIKHCSRDTVFCFLIALAITTWLLKSLFLWVLAPSLLIFHCWLLGVWQERG